MSRTIFTKSILILFVTISLLLAAGYWRPAIALAQEPDYDRINNIAKQLNCPTCAGINLADCRTQTCAQWKGQIGDLVQQGYSDQEVLDYFVIQYGVQVLQEPPKSGLTLALWILPVLALLAGGGWLIYTIRGWARGKTVPVVETSAADVTNNGHSPPEAGTPADYLSQVEKDLGIEEV